MIAVAATNPPQELPLLHRTGQDGTPTVCFVCIAAGNHDTHAVDIQATRPIAGIGLVISNPYDSDYFKGTSVSASS